MDGYLQRRGVRLALLVAIVGGALFGIYVLRGIFAPLLLGFLIAYVLDPFADALEARRFSRMGAVLVIFISVSLVALGLTTVGAVYTVRGVKTGYHKLAGEKKKADFPEQGVPTVEQFEDSDGDGIYDPGYLSRAQDAILDGEFLPPPVRAGLRTWIERQREAFARTDVEQEQSVVEALDLAWTWGTQRLRASVGFADESSASPGPEPANEPDEADGNGFAILSYLILTPLYVFFFLLQIDPLIAGIRRYLPAQQKSRIERIFGQSDQILAAFFRGRLIVCLIKGGLTAIGLLLLGVPFWFPLGMSAGFLSLIPYVGIYVSMIPAVLLVWFEHRSGLRLGGVLAVYGVMEAVEGLVLIPRFLGKEVGLHPLTIIVTLLVFGQVFGFVGVLLSVPLAAIAKILAVEFVMPIIKSFADPEALESG